MELVKIFRSLFFSLLVLFFLLSRAHIQALFAEANYDDREPHFVSCTPLYKTSTSIFESLYIYVIPDAEFQRIRFFELRMHVHYYFISQEKLRILSNIVNFHVRIYRDSIHIQTEIRHKISKVRSSFPEFRLHTSEKMFVYFEIYERWEYKRRKNNEIPSSPSVRRLWDLEE